MTSDTPRAQIAAVTTPAEFAHQRSIVPAVAIGTTATCYAFGLLIVNVYLNRYGVYNGELVVSSDEELESTRAIRMELQYVNAIIALAPAVPLR